MTVCCHQFLLFAGLVKFRGALVDVAKLMAQLERVDKDRNEAEARMIQLKSENTKLSDKYHKSNSTIKLLNSDVKEYRDKLKSSEENLSRTTVSHIFLYYPTFFCCLFTTNLLLINCNPMTRICSCEMYLFQAYSKLFQSTLTDIRDKIEPVLKSTAMHSREEHPVKREKEQKHDESKSRWEKSSKESAKEAKQEKAEVKQEPVEVQQGDEDVEKKEAKVEK